MAVDAPASDDLPILPPDASPAQPSIAEQQRQHAADQPTPPPASDDSLPIGPPPILNTSFRDNRSGALWDDFGHGVGLGTRNVIEGVTALPTALLDASTYPGRWLERQFGADVTAPSDLVSKGLDVAGLPIAQTDAEKRRAEIIRGGASMLTPMSVAPIATKLGMTVPGALATLFPDITSPVAAAGQVASGGVGAATGDYLAENAPDAWKPTARLVGNFAGSGLTGALISGAGTLVNAATGVRSTIADALDRLGITPRTAGAVSQSPGVQGTEAILSRVPTASGVLQPKQQQMVDDFGRAIDSTANKMDPAATTADQAGRIAQDAIRDWRDNTFPKMEDNAWKPVNDVMQPAGDVVDPSGYRAALQRAAADVRLANMPETQKVFASGQIQKWLDALDADAPAGTKLSWNQAQAIKQRVGDALATPDLVGSIGSNALNGVYGGLANDMKISAVLNGAGSDFDAANAFSAAGRTFINNTLSKAISGSNELKESISGEDAAKALLNGNSLDQQSLRLMIPKAADALAAWKLRSMAQARPGQQGAGATTSTGTFLTNLRTDQLRKPEGTAALFNDPEVAQNVQDLGTVAGQFRGVEKNMNAPNTAASLAVLGAVQHLLQTLASGNVREAGAVATGLTGPYAIAKGLTTPSLINIAKAQRAPGPAIPGLLGGALVNQATMGPPTQP